MENRRFTQTIQIDTDTRKQMAVYALGDWYLDPSFLRVCKRMKELLRETICFFDPVPKDTNGLLHQRLLTREGTDESIEMMECIANILAEARAATSITYRGLIRTETGVSMVGFTEEKDQLLAIRRAIQDATQIPSDTSFSVELFRWIKQPDGLQLFDLDTELKRWSECTFGELRVAKWIVGMTSWSAREKEREDYFAVPVQLHICHRGNLQGPVKPLENNFGLLIQRAIQGLDVEIDVWYHEGSLWLGHDAPDYKITLDWLASCKRRLIHCKDGKTLEYLMLESGKRALDLHLFYHTNEHYAITTKGHIMVCPGQPLLQGSLCMMPEMANYTEEEKRKCFSICSDRRDAVSTHPDH
jgi:hypothetical protein